jgi:L-threonate 2-dehydrogenase
VTTIAFIGLGAMGRPMARRLVEAQHRVTGFDLNPDALRYLESVGGHAAASAAEAARGADALVLMVVNAEQAEAALFAGNGSDRALEALKAGAQVILMATCPPAKVQAIAAKVEATGRSFIDAPVSGGVVGAEAGTLTIMAAAPTAAFERARPILAAMGSRLFHVGEQVGQGATVKTVNQLLCGVHIAVMAEAFALAEKAGVDTTLMLDILSESAASSWMLRNRGPRMLQDAPEVTSAVNIFVKDLGIVMAAGTASHAALPLAAAAHQMFLAASGAGHGKADDSQVIRAYRALNGSPKP